LAFSQRFEVASIKPNVLGYIDLGRGLRGLSGQTRCRAVDTRVIPGDLLQAPAQGRCYVRNSTLKEIINTAYGFRFGPARSVLNQMIVGGPAWAETDVFDIEAKAEDPATVTNQQMLVMLQSLLTERFKLKFHKETKEVSGYALLVAAGGSKLKEADPAEPQSFIAAPVVKGQKIPVLTLANVLAQRLGRPVFDQTSLTGLYDFTLKWTPDEIELGPNGLPRPAGDPSGPSLMTAIQEQLGLRLQSQKVPTEVVVIDSVERPTAN
jgi:uncharacterized protein (TIGR03435 family)